MRATRWQLLFLGVVMLFAAGMLAMEPSAWRAWGCAALGLYWLGDAMRLPGSALARNLRDPFGAGMLFFALGHLCYAQAFWASMRARVAGGLRLSGVYFGIEWLDSLLIVALLAGIAYWTLWILPTQRPEWLKGAALGYTCLLMLMVACACSAAWTGMTVEPILWLGAALCVVSNILRAREIFLKRDVRHQLAWVWGLHALAQVWLLMGLANL